MIIIKVVVLIAVCLELHSVEVFRSPENGAGASVKTSGLTMLEIMGTSDIKYYINYTPTKNWSEDIEISDIDSISKTIMAKGIGFQDSKAAGDPSIRRYLLMLGNNKTAYISFTPFDQIKLDSQNFKSYFDLVK